MRPTLSMLSTVLDAAVTINKQKKIPFPRSLHSIVIMNNYKVSDVYFDIIEWGCTRVHLSASRR